MKLQFIFAPEDHLAFVLHQLDQAPQTRQAIKFEAVLWNGLALVIFGWLAWTNKDWVLFVIPLVTVPVLFFLFGPSTSKNYRQLAERAISEGRNEGLYGPVELELSDDCLAWRSDGRSTTIRLSYLEKIVLTHTHLFLYTTNATAFVVPRAFVTDDEVAEWLEYMRDGVKGWVEHPAAAIGNLQLVLTRPPKNTSVPG